MQRWLREHLKQYMIRPIIYRSCSHFLAALILALLWNRYVNTGHLLSLRVHAYPIFAVLFGALAWFDYLRLDGVRLPRVKLPKLERKKPAFGAYSSMADYIDEEIVPFAELTEDEQDTCRLISNLICGIAFLILSAVR